MPENWSEEELEASVRSYIEMREKTSSGESFSKKHYYEKLSKQFRRSEKAFEYRMQNISAVYEFMGRQWIPGLKPMRNVGPNVAQSIETLIQKVEKQTINKVARYQAEIEKLKISPPKTKPSGSKKPPKTSLKTDQYVRDPEVAAWVYNSSKGICESCNKPSPFKKSDGTEYLEIHHVKRLADGGSDTVQNAVAICPNCHRELHYGEKKEEKLGHLFSEIQRLIRE